MGAKSSNHYLKSYKDWAKVNENVHSEEAMQQYKTGVNNDITLDAEDENGIYDAYMERMIERLAKHKIAYNNHLKGSLKTIDFIYDMEITKRLMEDFMAYMDRFSKLAKSGQKKSGND